MAKKKTTKKKVKASTKKKTKKKVKDVTKSTRKKEEVLIDAIGHASTVQMACKSAKITPKTFYRWMKDKPEFADAIRKAKDDLIVKVEHALYRKALYGDKDMMGHFGAQVFILINKGGWHDTRSVEVKGKLEMPAFTELVKALSAEKRKELEALNVKTIEVVATDPDSSKKDVDKPQDAGYIPPEGSNGSEALSEEVARDQDSDAVAED